MIVHVTAWKVWRCNEILTLNTQYQSWTVEIRAHRMWLSWKCIEEHRRQSALNSLAILRLLIQPLKVRGEVTPFLLYKFNSLVVLTCEQIKNNTIIVGGIKMVAFLFCTILNTYPFHSARKWEQNGRQNVQQMIPLTTRTAATVACAKSQRSVVSIDLLVLHVFKIDQ